MSKSPAFQLYASDIYMDTNEWSAEAFGIYNRLLAHQWVNGSIPNDIKKLSQISFVGIKTMSKRWPEMVSKFRFDETNRGRNPRMELEREKQQKYKELQSQRGKAGMNRRWHTNVTDVITDVITDVKPRLLPARLLPEDNSSSSSSLYNNKTFCDTSTEMEIVTLLLNEILQRKPDYKKPNKQVWAKHIDKMIRIDKRPPDKIREIVLWCQKDDFWQNNILSTKKLREHFDALQLKMEHTPKKKEIDDPYKNLPRI